MSPTKSCVPHDSIKKTYPEKNLMDAPRLNYFLFLYANSKVNDFQVVPLQGQQRHVTVHLNSVSLMLIKPPENININSWDRLTKLFKSLLHPLSEPSGKKNTPGEKINQEKKKRKGEKWLAWVPPLLPHLGSVFHRSKHKVPSRAHFGWKLLSQFTFA